MFGSETTLRCADYRERCVCVQRDERTRAGNRLDRRHPCLHECEARKGTRISIREKLHAAERRGVAGRDACAPVACAPVAPVLQSPVLQSTCTQVTDTFYLPPPR